MKKLITIIVLFISLYSYSQSDSVKMKIVRVGTVDGKKVYWLKNTDTKERFVTICDCKTERKKGEYVMIAKKDLVIIKDSFKRRDIE